MAHFIAMIHGDRGVVSRLGTKKSGIGATVEGWDSGVRVQGWHRSGSDQDVFEIHATTGSIGRGDDRLIGSVLLAADGTVIFAPARLPKED